MNSPFLLAAGLLFSATVCTQAIVVGQVDTFEDGTTQNWAINLLGMGAPPTEVLPTNISSGGPAGVDDHFLLLTSVGGAFSGGRLTVINFNGQWAGDYLQAGIDAIQMDVFNFGNTDLSLRLLFEDPGAGPPSNVAISTEAITVPSGGGWQTILFPVATSDFAALLGDTETALRNTTALRILHSSTANFPGEPIASQLGVDNIQARAVPDSGATALLLSLGVGALALLRRNRPQADCC